MSSRIRALSFAVTVSTIVIGLTSVTSGALGTRIVAPRAVSHTFTLKLPAPFKPVAPKGSKDLYHCSLLDPRVATNQMIVRSTFVPGHPSEVHHAILYLVPKSLATIARTADNHGKGWTCFGGPAAPGAGAALGGFGSAVWLAGWSPGHGPSVTPIGTGVPLPAGSLIVMQVHYNLLAGAYPDQSKATFTTVDMKGSGLLPLSLKLFAAPINMPCPPGVSGPLCDRKASLIDIGKRFGQSAISFDNALGGWCNAYGNAPSPGNTAACTWGVGGSYRLLAITPHMHLLGTSMTVTLDPGTTKEKVLLNVPSYDFHYQRSYNITPITVSASDRVRVSCTYDPTLRGKLPYLKDLPPRYVLWADGSSDEMCLATVSAVSSNATPLAAYSTIAPNISWPNALSNALTGSTATPSEGVAARNNLLAQLTAHLAHCGI